MNKILIIEDDQIVANIYRNKFSHEGYEVEVALDGDSGRKLADEFLPNLIILDLVLPKISGVELTKGFRADARFKDVPIIVFSNTYLTNMVQDAWKAGATKCLSKANCTPRQIIEVIRTVLGSPANSATSGPKAEAPRHAASPVNAPAGPVVSAQVSAADAEFQADVKRKFIASMPGTLAALRAALQALIKSTPETQLRRIEDLYRHAHALTGNAGVAGMNLIAQTADAFEALLRELHQKPRSINASTMRTVAIAIDFVAFMFEHADRIDLERIPGANILVVDDEIISRRAVVHALERAKLKASDVDDSAKAFEFLTHSRYDLIFLDVDMPGMNGFELCTKLRALPAYKKTPVVFVTSLTDFESRANSMMSGGNDFIAKPFLAMELALKGLIFIMRAKLDPAYA